MFTLKKRKLQKFEPEGFLLLGLIVLVVGCLVQVPMLVECIVKDWRGKHGQETANSNCQSKHLQSITYQPLRVLILPAFFIAKCKTLETKCSFHFYENLLIQQNIRKIMCDVKQRS